MPKKSQRAQITRETAAWVKWLYANTHLNQAQIAALFDLNQGRVSEVVCGHKFANVAPNEYKGSINV